MKTKSLVVQVAIALSFLIVYSPAAAQSIDIKTIEIRLDPGSATADPASNVFKDISYLPLQTTKESLFQEISQLEITAKRYIIWDQSINCLVIFDKSGKFISKISNKNNSVDTPFKQIDHFSIDEVKGEILINDDYSNFFYLYSFDGKFLSKQMRPGYWGLFYIRQQNFSAFTAGYNFDYVKSLKKSPHNIVVERSTGQIDFYLPFDTAIARYDELWSSDQGFFNNHNGTVNLAINYNYNIYTIDQTGNLWNSYRFVLPALSAIPDDFLTNRFFKPTRSEYLNINKEVVYGITDIYYHDEKLAFQLLSRASKKNFLYDLKTGDLKSLTDLILDKSTAKLPMLGKRILALDEKGRLVSQVSAPTLFDFRSLLSSNKNWMKDVPAALEKFFKSNSQQNPVLTFLNTN